MLQGPSIDLYKKYWQRFPICISLPVAASVLWMTSQKPWDANVPAVITGKAIYRKAR